MFCPFQVTEGSKCDEGECAVWRPGSGMCSFLVIANELLATNQVKHPILTKLLETCCEVDCNGCPFWNIDYNAPNSCFIKYLKPVEMKKNTERSCEVCKHYHTAVCKVCGLKGVAKWEARDNSTTITPKTPSDKLRMFIEDKIIEEDGE